ncbi:AbrB/MazE/SpoVT family DNA-binding domain-containing protein [Candidatus Roizmanbacteria bacterium]|nr:AbrB/MazE/SpoVT family DNA-binding domain-containing protein [Candidatus Roizmanbacteria bacterium]
MQIQTTITQKGQITIPKKLRMQYGFRSYDRVILEPGDDHVKVRPVKDILDLAGTFKPRKNAGVSVLKAREAMEKNYERF